ncbi:MAG TPA: preprotein translocase subunit SecG [Burkholderiaceae bacterium]|nr:preprotein translocase subunit SecG [Burkholderiaceae bacterium]
MQMLVSLAITVQVLSAIGVIVLVLLQHGKGADMGAAFGSGASGSLFGATGSANFLSRITAVCATVFFLCTLGLAFAAHYRPAAPGSVMERVVPATPRAPVDGSIPTLPGAPAAAPGASPAEPRGAGADTVPPAPARGNEIPK